MVNEKIYQDLLQKVQRSEQVRKDEPLSAYTFTHTGGRADILVMPERYEEVRKIAAYAAKEGIPVTTLGRGSNVIIRDGGIRGIVLILTRLNHIRLEDSRIVAECGAAIIDVSQFALDNCLTGLEFACGIPGSVGGALYMNAGAYGGETAHVLSHVSVLDQSGNLLQLTREELNMGYRSSAISRNNYIALEGTFSLAPGDAAVIKAEMDRLTALRELKQPLEYPSCGSVFKRPVGHFAGKLIQDSGLQGTRIGGVEISKKHAGFMVNVDHGTATDYLKLIHYVQQTVKKKFNVTLETEVRIIGEN
ncbi:MAG: UDP-N-acetylmuramate dehydrogenase [Sporolactobacillus sp.]